MKPHLTGDSDYILGRGELKCLSQVSISRRAGARGVDAWVLVLLEGKVVPKALWAALTTMEVSMQARAWT